MRPPPPTILLSRKLKTLVVLREALTCNAWKHAAPAEGAAAGYTMRLSQMWRSYTGIREEERSRDASRVTSVG